MWKDQVKLLRGGRGGKGAPGGRKSPCHGLEVGVVETMGGPWWLAWKGVPGGWSAEIGRGQTVKGLTQQASQCGFFPEEDGEPLEWGSDRITLSFQVISQAAMHR